MQVTGVNAVARSSGGSVLAVALDFGVIALYRYARVRDVC
jgi:hypothetical protein